jgi:hypothetical protein
MWARNTRNGVFLCLILSMSTLALDFSLRVGK